MTASARSLSALAVTAAIGLVALAASDAGVAASVPAPAPAPTPAPAASSASGAGPAAATTTGGSAPSTTAPAHAGEHAATDAVGPCEGRVTESIRELRKGSRDVQFTSDAQAVRAGAWQVDVKGEGRYTPAGRKPVGFRYTCTFDERARKATGVLFHEDDRTPPPTLQVARADPMMVLPEACESAMAAALRTANPRATSIVFDSMNRRVDPVPTGGTALTGEGTLARGPGLAAATFHYRCEYDAGGRVVSARRTD